MNTQMVFQNCEIPPNAAEKTRKPQSIVSLNANRKDVPQGQGESFKKKLENCEAAAVLQQVFSQLTAFVNSSEKTDISIACDSNKQELLSGIVGILEGFELLDYQTDNECVSEELLASISSANEITTQQLDKNTALNGLIEGAVNNTEQEEQLSEQFARMLTNNQLDLLPKETQEEILKVVGEYLGSFESTNKEQHVKMLNESIVDSEPIIDSKLIVDSQPIIDSELMDSELTDSELVIDKNAKSDSLIKAKTALQNEVTKTKTKITQTEKSSESNIIQEPNNKDVAVSKKSDVTSNDVLGNIPINVTINASGEDVKEIKETANMLSETQNGAELIEENVIRIVDKVSIQSKEGRYDFDVELKPDFLGKMNIKLTMEDGDIKMQIKTEDLAVKGLFSDEVTALQTMLKDKGIIVSDIDVTYESQTFTNNEKQTFEQNNDSGTGTRYWQSELSSEQTQQNIFLDAVTDLPDLYLRNSSVEFLA